MFTNLLLFKVFNNLRSLYRKSIMKDQSIPIPSNINPFFLTVLTPTIYFHSGYLCLTHI